MRTTVTTVNDNTDLEFSAETTLWKDGTYLITPQDYPDHALGFTAGYNPDTHVFYIFYDSEIWSEHRASNLADAVEMLRRYIYN